MPVFTHAQIKEIAEQLDCGLRAFYHKQTGELIFVPDTNRQFGMDTEDWQEDLDKLDNHFMDYQEVAAMSSTDAFRIMEDFAEQVPDHQFRNRLFAALRKRKPFREFRWVIDNDDHYRKQWFAFKNQRCFEWTKAQLTPAYKIDPADNGTD